MAAMARISVHPLHDTPPQTITAGHDQQVPEALEGVMEVTPDPGPYQSRPATLVRASVGQSLYCGNLAWRLSSEAGRRLSHPLQASIDGAQYAAGPALGLRPSHCPCQPLLLRSVQRPLDSRPYFAFNFPASET